MSENTAFRRSLYRRVAEAEEIGVTGDAILVAGPQRDQHAAL